MNAVTGRLLLVDLATHRLGFEDIPEHFYRQYLGGYGLGLPFLLERMDPACDPLGPGNILGLATGYLTGTGALIGSRFMVFGKSPSTRGWGDANCGGFFGKKMKNAGVDVILFKGISSSPVILIVEDGEARLEDARELWGLDCYQTEDRLKQTHGKTCEIACIGPAGENMSLIAGISTNKGRFAGRSGLGAVMGSKKVKAVVVQGEWPIEAALPARMKELRQKYLPVFKENPLAQGLSEFGTPLFYEPGLMSGDTPVKNWSSSYEALKDPERITAASIKEYKKKPYACSGCPIGCGGWLQVERGPYRTEDLVQKAEYETLGMMGPNLGIEDVEVLIKLNDLCNRLGLDTIGCGGLCALAIECYENGLIDRTDTDGLELTWGNSGAVVALVEQIGRSQGLGRILARGFEAAAREIGPEAIPLAMAVRNEGLPAHDPRWSAGLALTYFTDPTPSRHTQGSTTFPVAGYQQPEFTNEDQSGRAPHHKRNVNLTHALSAAGLCLFGFIVLEYQVVPEFLQAADGTSWNLEEFEEIGLRIAMARHLFNLKAGVNFKATSFPDRVLGRPPLVSGPTRGVTVDLDLMVDEFMTEMGLDAETTRPNQDVLIRLGLERFASTGFCEQR